MGSSPQQKPCLEGNSSLYFDDDFEQRWRVRRNIILDEGDGIHYYLYEPSKIYHLGRPQFPEGLGIGFINGIENDFEYAFQSAMLVSALARGYDVDGVYNATHGLDVDLKECAMGLHYIATPPVRLLYATWDRFFQRSPPFAIYLQVCHSQGALHVRNALLTYPEALRQRIVVIAIAPAAYILPGTCKKVYHYVSPTDPIPDIDRIGRKLAGAAIIVLGKRSDVSWYDTEHSFHSLIYRDALEDRIQSYLRRGR